VRFSLRQYIRAEVLCFCLQKPATAILVLALGWGARAFCNRSKLARHALNLWEFSRARSFT
jgi:hypothetical protein